MRIQGGYQTLSPIQICNGLAAVQAGIINYQGLRAYIALFEMRARREAAERHKTRDSSRQAPKVRYELHELQRLTEAPSAASARRLVNALGRAGLARFEANAVTLTETPLPIARDLLDAARGRGRGATRPVPIPRAVLRFVAACARPSIARTMLALALRGLAFDRKTGAIKSKGTAKASWIAEVAGVSLRAAKAARAELIRLGWISKDTGSHQWKLNRDGAYFVIDTAWRSAAARAGSAPPPPRMSTGSAPPYERPETPYGSKTRNSPLGFTEQEPSIRDVREGDLSRLSRMEALYWQAERAGLVRHSESMALAFLAASVRAREVGHDPPRMFSGIVRRGLWTHASAAQEEHARRALARYREDFPDAFRRRRLAA